MERNSIVLLVKTVASDLVLRRLYHSSKHRLQTYRSSISVRVVGIRRCVGPIKTQEDLTGRFFSFALLDIHDVLEERHDIVAPIMDQLVSYCLENALLVSLEDPETMEALREELDLPDRQIYNRLWKLEEDGQITVDRSCRLNTYQRIKET